MAGRGRTRSTCTSSRTRSRGTAARRGGRCARTGRSWPGARPRRGPRGARRRPARGARRSRPPSAPTAPGQRSRHVAAPGAHGPDRAVGPSAVRPAPRPRSRPARADGTRGRAGRREDRRAPRLGVGLPVHGRVTAGSACEVAAARGSRSAGWTPRPSCRSGPSPARNAARPASTASRKAPAMAAGSRGHADRRVHEHRVGAELHRLGGVGGRAEPGVDDHRHGCLLDDDLHGVAGPQALVRADPRPERHDRRAARPPRAAWPAPGRR